MIDFETFYVTTPIYYINGEPHIGHAYTTIVSDVVARFYRQLGARVFFLTGTDEHGLKVQRAAEAMGIEPQELADRNSAAFRELFERLDISHDRFIRTTEEQHRHTVEQIIERMKDNGDIYLDTYEGWYAASDEAFYAEDEIEDGHAIETGAEVEWVEEESYFFRLSEYREPLLDWYRAHHESVQPDERRHEIETFVAQGLRDLSISRTTFDWGIPFPDDPEHVVYVWVDALSNYLTGIGAFEDEETFEAFWPADVHFIGKDILRFHAVYWPAFLLSAGFELPRQIFSHGWWLAEGEKMSKSRGNFLDAFELAEQYDLDVLRYYLLREVPLGKDGNFVHARVVERNNNELADNVGNLVNRVTKMVQGFTDGRVPPNHESDHELDQDLRHEAFRVRDAIVDAMRVRQTHRALEELMGFSGYLNNYVHKTEPWKLRHDEERRERLEQVLYHALEGIRWLGVISYAFMPHKSEQILSAFGMTDPIAHDYETLDNWGWLAPGTDVSVPPVLFEKLEPPVEPEEPTLDIESLDAEQLAEEEPEESEESDKIAFDHFLDVEIRVGEIVEASPVEGADRLLRIALDVGEDVPRTVVAGIAKSYTPAELVGMRVAAVTNLEPARLFGIESQAMLLAAETEEGTLELTRYGDAVAPGTRIK
jgi:methionyl-tRNA synthetase